MDEFLTKLAHEVAAAGGFLVLKKGQGLAVWSSPDDLRQVGGHAVESLVRSGAAAFVAWRPTAREIRGVRDSMREAIPCVARVTPDGVRLRQFEVFGEVHGREEYRGNVLAVDAEESLRVAQLAGLVFSAPHATAREAPPWKPPGAA